MVEDGLLQLGLGKGPSVLQPQKLNQHRILDKGRFFFLVVGSKAMHLFHDFMLLRFRCLCQSVIIQRVDVALQRSVVPLL